VETETTVHQDQKEMPANYFRPVVDLLDQLDHRDLKVLKDNQDQLAKTDIQELTVPWAPKVTKEVAETTESQALQEDPVCPASLVSPAHAMDATLAWHQDTKKPKKTFHSESQALLHLLFFKFSSFFQLLQKFPISRLFK